MTMPEAEDHMAPDARTPRQQISATKPDWSRERPRKFWDPSRKLIRALRRYQAAKVRGGLIGKLAARRWLLSHRFWSMVSQADIPPNADIGGGLMMPHPNGVVIHSKARIGPNCLIMQQVTIGQNKRQRPVIGGGVDIGPGAKVLGGITVGDNAHIGANAVVLHDVPPWAVVAGVPARVIGSRHPPDDGSAS